MPAGADLLRRQNGAVVDTDEALRKWMVNTADKHGAAVMHVAGDDSGAAYAFSVGAWRRFGKPEVVVIGLPKEVAHAVVNTYVQRVGGGERFQPGQLYDGFLQGCPVTFEKVALQHYPEYLGSAFLVYNGPDFPAVQLIASSPDDGKFPWQPDAPGGFREYQPVLTDSGLPESWTPGTDGP
ncbi:DUF4262 domain-containing protein [Saccharopolyspora elongata]|uniref:DUF4262 domain-containing protein n=2 Tax=Pseudonocardiaceae TaxID=2070 RepID=A0A4R4ZB09_9PSEU|nr:DUF4262 domain-containing protein [Saccharopolyspora elongata]